MIAPMPSATRFTGPSVRFSVCAALGFRHDAAHDGFVANRVSCHSDSLLGRARSRHTKYTGTPSSTMISPGQV